jgi:hypothetical protein
LYYYFLPQQVVHFERLENCPRTVYTEEVIQDPSSEGIFNALKYRYALKYLGK